MKNLILLMFLAPLAMNVASTAKTPTEQFNEAMNLANSLKNSVQSDGNTIKVTKSTGETVTFDPKAVFKDQPGGYSSDPPQASYSDNADAMKSAAASEINRDTINRDANGIPIPTVGKMVTDNFKTRPIFKISKDDDFMVKSNEVISGAQNIGQSSSEVNCDLQQTTQEKCVPTFEQKSCNEAIRSVTRICEKTPKVKIITKDEVHPNCRRLVLKYGYRVWHQPGERKLLYHDFTPGGEDDIHLFDRPAQGGENECYLGYFICGCHFHENWRNDYENVWGQGVVPKNMQGYLRIEKIYRGKMDGTIFNVTTGKVVAEGPFGEGRINLPMSETQDQVFRFTPRGDYNHYSRIHNPHYHSCLGIVVFYAERIKRLKDPQITWEESCRDI